MRLILFCCLVAAAFQLHAQAITQGTTYVVTATPQSFSITPTSGWNVLAVTSAGSDWGIRANLAYPSGQSGAGIADLAVSNDGNGAGAFFPPDELTRFSGSTDAYIEHGTISVTPFATPTSFAWGATDIVHGWTVTVSQAGVSAVNVTTTAGTSLRWCLFAPSVGGDWNPRTDAARGPFDLTQPQSVIFGEVGTWCIVVANDGGLPASAATVSVTVATPAPLPPPAEDNGGDDGGCSTGAVETRWFALVSILLVLCLGARLATAPNSTDGT